VPYAYDVALSAFDNIFLVHVVLLQGWG
jgi:hypothetical protein